jgi:hypothetical protein
VDDLLHYTRSVLGPCAEIDGYVERTRFRAAELAAGLLERVVRADRNLGPQKWCRERDF